MLEWPDKVLLKVFIYALWQCNVHKTTREKCTDLRSREESECNLTLDWFGQSLPFDFWGKAKHSGPRRVRAGAQKLSRWIKLLKDYVTRADFYPCCFAAGWCLRVWRGGWGTVRRGATVCVRSSWLRQRKLHCNLEKEKQLELDLEKSINNIILQIIYLLI